MTQHQIKHCGIDKCSTEASSWIEDKNSKDDTFYLCPMHAYSLDNNDGVYAKIEDNKINLTEIAVYSCSEDCEVCNQ